MTDLLQHKDNEQLLLTKEPDKYLKENIYTQQLEATYVTYFLAQKLNNSGLMRNLRFFLLFGNQYFAYASKLQNNIVMPFKTLTDFPSFKIKIPLEQIKQIELPAGQKNLFIRIHLRENQKSESIKIWQIKFVNTKMVEQIFTKLSQNVKKSKIRHQLREKKIVTVSNQAKNSQVNASNLEKISQINISSLEKNQQIKQSGKVSKQQQQSIVNETQFPNLKDAKKQQQTPINKNSQVNIKQNIKTNSIYSYQQKKKSQIIPKKQQQQQNAQQQQQQSINQITILNSNKSIKAVSEKNKSQYQYQPKQIKQLTQSLQRNWNKQFLIQISQQIHTLKLIQQFKNFSEIIVKKIINQLTLTQPSYSPKIKGDESMLYQIQNVSIKLCFGKFLQVQKQEKISDSRKKSMMAVCEQNSFKDARNQFKNLNYVLKITKNKGKIRVPLATLVQYKGILALVKAISKQQQSNINEQLNTNQQLNKISVSSHIDKSKFLLSKNSIHKLVYPSSTEQIFLIQNLIQFLPKNIKTLHKTPQITSFNQENVQLRQQFWQKKQNNNYIFTSENVIVQKQIKDRIKQNLLLSTNFLDCLTKFIKDWEKFQIIPVNSQDLSHYIHKYGINIRYLGLIYNQTTSSLIKKICMAEITARSAKIHLRSILQKMIIKINVENNINQKKSLSVRQTNVILLQFVVEFLNSIVSNNTSSTWDILQQQAKFTFNIKLKKQEISQGYFIQALIYHCNLIIDWSKFDKKYILFRSRKIFKKQMFLGFATNFSKSYDFHFTSIYSEINSILDQQPSLENFIKLINILQLKTKPIESHFMIDRYKYSQLCQYLANYIKPRSLVKVPEFVCQSQIYEISDQIPISFQSINLAIAEIKWGFRMGKQIQSIKQSKIIIHRIECWCGQYHPLITEILLVLSQYYISKQKFKEAFQQIEMGISNCSRLVGINHPKTAELYFQLGEAHLQYKDKQKALNSYNKARIIFLNLDQSDRNLPYAQVCNKIGEIQFSIGKLNEAQSNITSALIIYSSFNGQNKLESQICCCFDLLARIYELSQNIKQHKNIVECCQNFLIRIQNPENLSKILKIILLPLFSLIQISQTNDFRALIQWMQQELHPSFQKSMLFIKQLIAKEQFCILLSQIFTNAKKILHSINQKQILNKWKPLESPTSNNTSQQLFLTMILSLVGVIGQAFLIDLLDTTTT